MSTENLQISFDDVLFNYEFFVDDDLMEKSQISQESLHEQTPPVPLQTLPEQLPPKFLKMEFPDYMVAFSGLTKSYCVGVVDMMESTKISAKLSPVQNSKYYQIFLNVMARILNRFGGMVIKSVGDSLMFYFPESSKGKRYGFMTCLEGGLAMIEAHQFIGQITQKEGLPPINYRVSCDYGPLVIMKQNESSSFDMIGPPMNICCKINRLALKNQFIIGSDLYEATKKNSDYAFSHCGTYDSELKSRYSIYSVLRK